MCEQGRIMLAELWRGVVGIGMLLRCLMTEPLTER